MGPAGARPPWTPGGGPLALRIMNPKLLSVRSALGVCASWEPAERLWGVVRRPWASAGRTASSPGPLSVCPRARASLASVTLFAPAGDSPPPNPTPSFTEARAAQELRGWSQSPFEHPPPTIASRQAEIVKRLSGICAQIVPFLTQEVSGPGGGGRAATGRSGLLDFAGPGSAGWPAGHRLGQWLQGWREMFPEGEESGLKPSIQAAWVQILAVWPWASCWPSLCLC